MCSGRLKGMEISRIGGWELMMRAQAFASNGTARHMQPGGNAEAIRKTGKGRTAHDVKGRFTSPL